MEEKGKIAEGFRTVTLHCLQFGGGDVEESRNDL